MKIVMSVLVFVAAASAQNGFPSNAVQGKPYSAEEITERVQTLADGTRLTQKPQHTMYYRDSAGRTRTERTIVLPPEGVSTARMINIEDPVGGYHIILDEIKHVARRSKMFELPPPPGARAVVAARQVPVEGAQRLTPERSRENLGPQMIEGVMVTGTRNTTTYPIGFFGNDRPLATVTETWMSPELGRVLQSKTSDLRTGDSTTRLTNISRTEPDPSLFQIPADYEIQDAANRN